MFSFLDLRTQSRVNCALWDGTLESWPSQNFSKESKNLENWTLFFFALLLQRTQDNSWVFCLQVGGSLIPHQVPGHLFAFSFSAQSPLPAVGLAPLMEKIWNDWMPVKQAQLSGSEVGPGRARTANTCSDVRVQHNQKTSASQPANKSLNNSRKFRAVLRKLFFPPPTPFF